MRVGFSLSPGGLLLPYHLGALQCLNDEGILQQESTVAVAGSSAGAIATLAQGCGLKMEDVLEATIAVSDECRQLGRAQGNLLPILQKQMDQLVGDEEFAHLAATAGRSKPTVGMAYRQVFPFPQQNQLQTTFDDREDLFRAVSFSCMFPFFSTNFPCLLDSSKGILKSRLMVDGYFSVPRDRFGCPDLDMTWSGKDVTGMGNGDTLENDGAPSISQNVDRTVAICCFPQSTMGVTAFDPKDCISPDRSSGGTDWTIAGLFEVATQATSREKLTEAFRLGYNNAGDWCEQEAKRTPSGAEHEESIFVSES